ncbi:MAG: pilus assembly protein TadG-related protein [Chloroflexota bacterium]|nr:pilus assembly protein TadG-related protein [Chloroflexota bacterium]
MRTVQRAQALLWLAVALPMLLAVTGLAIDGALLLAGRRELQSMADGAARAAATRVDAQALRVSSGRDVQLDVPSAQEVGLRYFSQSLQPDLAWDDPPSARVQVSRTRAIVTAQGALRTAFLRIAGVERVPVAATAYADVQHGIREPAGP